MEANESCIHKGLHRLTSLDLVNVRFPKVAELFSRFEKTELRIKKDDQYPSFSYHFGFLTQAEKNLRISSLPVHRITTIEADIVALSILFCRQEAHIKFAGDSSILFTANSPFDNRFIFLRS
jgi:hypothetical protein